MAVLAQRLPWRTPSSARHPSGAGAPSVYRPRHPAASLLYAVVQHHLETFLAHAAEADPMGYGVPTWVEKDFRAYLRCGILAYGLARARCDGCGHERPIPFSCKGRGICPSCNARRMAELAAHLTDHVLPHVPVRQWALSVPKRLRPYLHHNPEVAGAVLGIFLRAIRTTLRRTSPGAPPDAQLGAVSFLHRFGSSLNPHLHFHLVVLDGVFAQVPDGAVRFHETTQLDQRHWLDLQRVVQRRVLRHFRTHGLLDEAATEGMLTWQGSGGFSIDASVHIQGDDRGGLERLIRYCARPPFALERLHALAGIPSLASPQARLLYRFARPIPDGRTELVLSPLQLLERLSTFVPRAPTRSVGPRPPPPLPRRARAGHPPQVGRCAACCCRRHRATRISKASHAHTQDPRRLGRVAPPRKPRPRAPTVGGSWAVLLAHVYEVLPLLCSACGAEMRVLAFLTDPPVISVILLHLESGPPRNARCVG